MFLRSPLIHLVSHGNFFLVKNSDHLYCELLHIPDFLGFISVVSFTMFLVPGIFCIERPDKIQA